MILSALWSSIWKSGPETLQAMDAGTPATASATLSLMGWEKLRTMPGS